MDKNNHAAVPLLGCMGSTGTYHIIPKKLDGELGNKYFEYYF